MRGVCAKIFTFRGEYASTEPKFSIFYQHIRLPGSPEPPPTGFPNPFRILPLGKMQVNLLLPSLIRNFGCTEDTPPRKKCKRACFFLSAYSYLCPIHAGMVELVDTSDLGSDASRRGGSSPFIRTKEPFRRAPFSLSVRCKQVQIVCISSFCKGIGEFSEPEAESISQQTRGSTKGSGAEKRAA